MLSIDTANLSVSFFKHIDRGNINCLDAVGFLSWALDSVVHVVGSGIQYVYETAPYRPDVYQFAHSSPELYWLSPVNKLVLDARQRALTSQGRIEIQARITISVLNPPIAAVNSMTSILVMLASWQTH